MFQRLAVWSAQHNGWDSSFTLVWDHNQTKCLNPWVWDTAHWLSFFMLHTHCRYMSAVSSHQDHLLQCQKLLSLQIVKTSISSAATVLARRNKILIMVTMQWQTQPSRLRTVSNCNLTVKPIRNKKLYWESSGNLVCVHSCNSNRTCTLHH
jgi:hypothetical protein